LEKKLIIEIDGGQHNENEYDKERTNYLENKGFKVVRFWNNEVLNNMQICLDVIYKILNTPHPLALQVPLPQGAREKEKTQRAKSNESR